MRSVGNFSAVLFLLLVLLLPVRFAVPMRPWALHDLSILFPLPESLPSKLDFTARTNGVRGDWMPDALLKLMPSLEISISPDQLPDLLHVVGVRITQNEVRLVWQPLSQVDLPTGQTDVRAIDAALHTFYRFSDTEFTEFLSELKLLSDAHSTGGPGDSLQIHPVLGQERWQGAYGKGLRNLLLKFLGEENIFRITFMTVQPGNFQWVFGGFDIVNGNPVTMIIPGIMQNANPRRPYNIQLFVNHSVPPSEFLGGIGPAPQAQDDLNRLMSDSKKETADPAGRLLRAHVTARQIENPNLRNTENTDCVSCHVAGPARRWIEGKAQELKLPSQDTYVSKIYNLEDMSPARDRTDNLRNFGYFMKSPSVSQRVIHDTAHFAESL
jgi:hypothetical protein